jgi:hypothetical protein
METMPTSRPAWTTAPPPFRPTEASPARFPAIEIENLLGAEGHAFCAARPSSLITTGEYRGNLKSRFTSLPPHLECTGPDAQTIPAATH